MQQPCHLTPVEDLRELEPVRLAPVNAISPVDESALWPEMFTVPSGPFAAAAGVIAERRVRATVARLPMRLVYPDGSVVGAGDATSPVLALNEPERLARRLGRHGLIGFGESFMAQEWESADLVGVLTVLAPGFDELVPSLVRRLGPLVSVPQQSSPLTERERQLRNAAAHYDDVSSDLFVEFLDETMTYSSALFDRLPAQWSDLADAQRHKIDRLLDAAEVGPGSRLLEIGSGWGELCVRAAERGAEVHSVTPSERQGWMVRQRMVTAGQTNRVRVEVCDFRDIEGTFDAVISVEMIEAVGHRSWPDFFRTVGQLVRPGGRVVVQAIAQPHTRMLATRARQTWTQRYIFPGGMLPSAKAVLDLSQRHGGLRPVDMFALREHYAETLRLWRERFLQRRKTLAHVGFDEVFARMWELHLAGREAGFRSGVLNVYQWTFVREDVP